MAVSKKPRPSSPSQQGSIGLLAVGSSGGWQIDIDETTSGPDRWFAQIEGPHVYLHFEIPSLDTIEQVKIFLADSRNQNGKNAVSIASDGTLALGAGRATTVNLVHDDEFLDRYFLVVESKGGLVVRFTLAGDDLTHVLEALRQVMEDLP